MTSRQPQTTRPDRSSITLGLALAFSVVATFAARVPAQAEPMGGEERKADVTAIFEDAVIHLFLKELASVVPGFDFQIGRPQSKAIIVGSDGALIKHSIPLKPEVCYFCNSSVRWVEHNTGDRTLGSSYRLLDSF